MRLAKTSILYFVAEVATSFVGLAGTIYISRVLGADGLGIYASVIALLACVSIPINGVGSAITKRMSEKEDMGNFLTAGFVINFLIAVVVSAIALILKPYLRSYIGAPVVPIFVLLVVSQALFISISRGLEGQKKVAQTGPLKTFDRIVRVGVQISLLILGYGVVGLVMGHTLGFVFASFAGVFFYSVKPNLPSKKHFKKLLSYGRYSWIGSMKVRTFAWMDTLVLKLFVAASFVGVYEAAWGISSLLLLASNSIQKTLFPEVSELKTQDDYEKIHELVNEALSFAGIFLIPGFAGAAILGSKILRIYGSEFTIGGWVLLLLIFARTIDAYGKQLLSTINAVDRPEMAFRVNLSFIIMNVLLNFVLIYLYGWYGAAVATALSSFVVLGLGYHYLSNIIGKPSIPFEEISKQVAASIVMAAFVGVTRLVLPWSNMYTTVGLVFLGAGIYALVLLTISLRFREKMFSLIPAFIKEKIPF